MVDAFDLNLGVYPRYWVEDGQRWILWKMDEERKIPRNPRRELDDYTPEGPADSRYDAKKNPEIWYTLEEAKEWKRRLVGHELGYYMAKEDYDEFPDEPKFPFDGSDLPDEPAVGMVDWDDVIDPEEGRVHPVYKAFLKLFPESYWDVSQSWTGSHTLGFFDLPEDERTLEIDISNEQFPEAEIEVYKGGRFTAMTGAHIAETDRDFTSIQPMVDALVSMYEKQTGNTDHSKGEAWVPENTREELADVEETDDISEVRDAIKQVRPRDIYLKSSKTEERADGTLSFDPSWEKSESGTRLGWDPEIGWIYRKGGQSIDALQVVAAEEGIISRVTDNLEGADFLLALEELRDRGAHVPKLEYTVGEGDEGPFEYEEGTFSAIPRTKRMRNAEAGWLVMGDHNPVLSKEEVHERVEDHIRRAIRYSDNALLDSLMTTGKTTSLFKVANEEDTRVAYFAPTTDLRAEAAETCEEYGLSVLNLPVADRDCPVFAGEHGKDLKRRVKDLRDREVTPREIHDHMNLPCEGDDHECPYRAGWSNVQHLLDERDVVIGDYAHANLDFLSMGRVAAVDEDPSDSFTTKFVCRELQTAVNTFCEIYDDFPFDGFADVMERRLNPDAVAEAEAWFDAFEFERDPDPCFNQREYHAYAPHATAALLFAEPAGDADRGYPVERTVLPDTERHLAVVDRGGGRDSMEVHLQTPPDWEGNRGLLALDGTPNKKRWERVLGLRLNHREVLPSDAEKKDYIRETLGIEGIAMSPYVKPHTSGEHVNVEKALAQANALQDEFDQPLAVFDALAATNKYEKADIEEDEGGPAGAVDNFMALRGKNEYGDFSLALVAGSPHYGHDWVQQQAAWDDVAVCPEGKGTDLTFETDDGAPYGDQYLEQMREANVAQAALRVGRDGSGAIVAFGTTCYPDWFPIAGEGAVIKTWTDHQRNVLTALSDLQEVQDEVRTQDVVDHPSVECGERWVTKTLHQFEKYGYVEAERDGRALVWDDDQLDAVNEHGEVEVPDVDLGEIPDGELSELSRNVIFTPAFGVPAPSGRDDSLSDGDLSVRVKVDGSERVEDGPPPG